MPPTRFNDVVIPLAMVIAPVSLSIAEAFAGRPPALERGLDRDTEIQARFCIRGDGAPVHEELHGRGDIEAKLSAGTVVWEVASDDTWHEVVYARDDVLVTGWIVERYLVECPDEPIADGGVTPTGARPETPKTFDAAKRAALSKIYADVTQEFYCACGFDHDDKSVDPSQCGYAPRNENARAHRIEWEHIVPAHAFGHFRACWTDPDECGDKGPGRACCADVDEEFRSMEADLHNLAPAVGELNGDRSNFVFGTIAGEAREYGECDFEVDRSNQIAEPPEHLLGDVARAYLYMSTVWGLPLTPAQRVQFEDWHELDPADDWERERNRRITEIQGVANPFVE
jgi:deoxyribonuclease-1